MKKFVVFLAALLVISVSTFAAQGVKGSFAASAWVVYWDPGNQSLASFEAHASLLDRIYAEWYNVEADGLPHFLPKVTPALKARTRAAAQRWGVKIFMMGGNYDNKINDHDSKRVEKFLFNAGLRKRHIAALLQMARAEQADGIDIDYENLRKPDRDAFSLFMHELSQECQKQHLLLGCAVAPKTDPEGSWDGNQSHDYRAIGQAVDVLHVMTYDNHWGTSPAGTISPAGWSGAVSELASSLAGPQKVEMGFAAYGYDWQGSRAETIGWQDLLATLKKYHAQAQRDAESQEITFSYPQHTVWFCDAGSYLPRFDVIKKNKLAGLAIWRLGSEDPRMWNTIKKEKGI